MLTYRDGDEGFTIVELIVGLMISAVIALVAGKVLSSASASLTAASDRTLAAQSVIRYNAVVKYDFARAKSATFWGTTFPSTTPSCFSGSSSTWNPNSSSGAVIRSLAQLSVNKLIPGTASSWWESENVTVTYEIRRTAFSRNLELWRRECPTGLLPSQERLLILSNSSSWSLVPAGSNATTGIFFCPGKTSSVSVLTATACPIGSNVLLTNSYVAARIPATVNKYKVADLIVKTRIT